MHTLIVGTLDGKLRADMSGYWLSSESGLMYKARSSGKVDDMSS
jgi:hypothetical protein